MLKYFGIFYLTTYKKIYSPQKKPTKSNETLKKGKPTRKKVTISKIDNKENKEWKTKNKTEILQKKRY